MDFSKFPLDNQNLLNDLMRNFSPDLNNESFLKFLKKVLELKKQPSGLRAVLNKIPFEDHSKLLTHSQHKNNYDFIRDLYNRKFKAFDYSKKEEEVRRESAERIKFFEGCPEFMRGNCSVLRRNLLGYLQRHD